MIKLYGTSMSRAARSLWALEELGLKFEHVPVSLQVTRKSEYLKINPNGHVPALDDDGMILWESMAINLYLAEKYGKAPLWPGSVQGHGAAYQWSLWGITELEAHLIALLQHKMFLPAEQRSAQAITNATEALKAPLKVLDVHLTGREFLLGKDFTIADLNVAAVASLGTMVGLDLSATPKAAAWLQKCLGRESSKRAAAYK